MSTTSGRALFRAIALVLVLGVLSILAIGSLAHHDVGRARGGFEPHQCPPQARIVRFEPPGDPDDGEAATQSEADIFDDHDDSARTQILRI